MNDLQDQIIALHAAFTALEVVRTSVRTMSIFGGATHGTVSDISRAHTNISEAFPIQAALWSIPLNAGRRIREIRAWVRDRTGTKIKVDLLYMADGTGVEDVLSTGFSVESSSDGMDQLLVIPSIDLVMAVNSAYLLMASVDVTPESSAYIYRIDIDHDEL